MDFGLDRLDPALDRLSKLPKAYRIALVPGIVIVLLALYYVVLFQGTNAQLLRLESQRDQKQRKLNEARSAAANMGPFRDELASLETQLNEALRRLPDSQELPILLVDISTLGKKTGLEVTSFRPLKERKVGFYAEVPIHLEFSGSYHDVARFFDRVAKLPRIVNVGRLDMGVKSRKGEPILRVTGTATTFRFLGEDE